MLLNLNRAQEVMQRHQLELKEPDGIGAPLLPACDMLREIRAIKTPDEIDRLKKASDANEFALEALLAMMQPGVSWGELG